jgi:hypothetical protein
VPSLQFLQAVGLRSESGPYLHRLLSGVSFGHFSQSWNPSCVKVPEGNQALHGWGLARRGHLSLKWLRRLGRTPGPGPFS